jgi:hypothetical protein
VTGDPGVALEHVRAAIVARDMSLEYADQLGGALGLSIGGRIQILNGLTAATEVIVLAHEFAHELLHRGEDRPQSRDIRELEAEAVAFVVGQSIGLDVADAARDYIHLYRGDSAALAESLERVQRTAAIILESLDHTQGHLPARL